VINQIMFIDFKAINTLTTVLCHKWAPHLKSLLFSQTTKTWTTIFGQS